MDTKIKQLQKQVETLQLDVNVLKLKSLMGSVKELSPKEKKKRAAEIDSIRKEKGEQGVQEFLLKKFGF